MEPSKSTRLADLEVLSQPLEQFRWLKALTPQAVYIKLLAGAEVNFIQENQIY